MGARKRILLVEDHEQIYDFLSRRLERRGYEVIIAVDGAQGVSKARSEQPDVILMDMSMPVMDGWTAAGILKRDASVAHLPIIALTAHALDSDRERAEAAGCDHYHAKPVEFTHLLAQIEACS
ncbi:response regulator [Lichenihabitans sp. Uapishka_5]|uniref:response regulator n=1 Tax=Lichenihabitans sp. Uapishka_5 TaxID=3037302 RepID=UPI0029E7CB6F|nr:response regulator [Lichenihabitans sp. Uapishka_5]MDX7952846.1 response regulator [Lichenihabitans sp. Uapishka_5]